MATKNPDSTEKKQDTKFKPGVSGNPKGRKKGSRHKAGILLEQMLTGQAKALMEQALEIALAGDGQMLKTLIGKLLPDAKDHPIDFQLPKVEAVEDLPKITSALLAAVAAGEIGATEAEKLSKIVSAHHEALKLVDINNRVATLEAQLKGEKI
jgi:hypothetical protein